MSRDSKVYLEDILEAIRKIREFTGGTSLAALSKDAKTLDAVIRNLEVIGEASSVYRRRSGASSRTLSGRKSPAFEISSFTSVSASTSKSYGM